MKMVDREPKSYAEAEERAKTTAKLSGALRVGLTIVFMVFIGLIYCLHYVRPGDAEYYVSIFTLILNGILFIAMMTTAVILNKKQENYRALMDRYRKDDEPDPWKL